jgi:hypothetical protein
MNERKWLGGIIKDENGNLIHVRDEEAYDLGTLLQYHAMEFIKLAEQLQSMNFRKFVKEVYTELTFQMEDNKNDN